MILLILALEICSIVPIIQQLLLQNLINLLRHEAKTSPEPGRTVNGDEAGRRKSFSSDSKEFVNTVLCKAGSTELRQNGEIMDVVLVCVGGYLAK